MTKLIKTILSVFLSFAFIFSLGVSVSAIENDSVSVHVECNDLDNPDANCSSSQSELLYIQSSLHLKAYSESGWIKYTVYKEDSTNPVLQGILYPSDSKIEMIQVDPGNYSVELRCYHGSLICKGKAILSKNK